MGQEILKAKCIKKSFFGNEVLKGVDFEVQSGEIHGLVGENGAGKSTLMKIITGVYTKNSGEIYLDGKEVDFSDPGKARDAGVSIIHQEFNQFSNLSVAENIFLDRKEYRSSLGVVNWKKMREDAGKVLGDLGASFDVEIPERLLSVREQQLVEIAKAISSNCHVLIMDEPTAALPENEVGKLFDVIRVLKEKGVAVIYISHRMKEIEQICDRVTVLRDGKKISTLDMEQGRIDEVISQMIGKSITNYYTHTERTMGETILKVENLSGHGVSDVSFQLHSGEVLGLYGLAGSGATETAEMIMGLKRPQKGSVTMRDKKLSMKNIGESMNSGIGYVPSDRRQEGIILNMPISQNTILANLDAYDGRIMLNDQKISSRVEKAIENLKIKCVSSSQEVMRLSGGNQQKVVLAKWLDRNPHVLILNEPTRGVDVGAKSEIYKLIDDLANSNLAILFISSELPEVMGVSDAITVMCRGHITGSFRKSEIGQDTLLKAASGRI